MTSNWFFARTSQKVGPFTVHQIQQLAALGMLTAADHLLEEGSSKWVAASSLPWLTFSQGSQKYLLRMFGKDYGPYTLQQVRAALLSSRVPRDTPARPQEGQQWRPLHLMTEFQHALATTVKTAEPAAPASRIGGATMTREEAELYLAGKQGDSLAKLVYTLQLIRKRFTDNPAMQEILDKNIHDLLDLREKGNILSEPIPGGRP